MVLDPALQMLTRRPDTLVSKYLGGSLDHVIGVESLPPSQHLFAPALLAGIVLANMISLSLYLYLSESERASLSTASTDRMFDFLELGLVESKFYTIFSVLFGIGFSILIFRGVGLGLGGTMRPTLYLALGIAIYLVQLAASRIWLGRFQYGPLEWLWRMLTYGTAIPLRKAQPLPSTSEHQQTTRAAAARRHF